MQTSIWPNLRPLTVSARLLGILLLGVVSAPMCAAATGPIITNASIGPATPLPVTGGGITVTATVTDADGPIASVIATVSLNGAVYLRRDDTYNNTVTLYNSGNNVYTGTIPSAGTNTGSTSYAYTATVTAKDQNLSNTVSATGQAVQLNDNTGPSITNASVGPATLPAVGGAITITATVTDSGNRPVTNVTATVSLNGAVYLRSDDTYSNTISLSKSSGNVYTGTIPSASNNTNATFNVYTATVTATNDLSLISTVTAAGQTVQVNGNDNQPQSSHTHILWNHAPDGQVSLWIVNPDYSFTNQEYGPFAGWTAKAVSDGPDGVAHILWNRTSDGMVSLWDITSAGRTNHEYGPFPGWSAVGLSSGL